MDGFWEDELDPWDSGAGVLLVREAGGFVSDYRGSDRIFERREYIAASGAIHSRLQKLIGPTNAGLCGGSYSRCGASQPFRRA